MRKSLVRKGLLLGIIILFIGSSVIPTISGIVPSRTYTLDADFDEGILVDVEHETVHDQLQLSKNTSILPFIWVPNKVQGTVSKVDTNTGNELGRYRVAPQFTCDPSRTTVDLEGNCWVGCRNAGTVVKIGLFEVGNWIDRNSDGIPQTSQDLNNDGDITGAELLPFGQDECVLFEVLLRPGYMGTFIPGTIPLTSYDYGHWSTSPRGLAIDASNNLWAGTWNPCKYHYIDGATAAILNTVDLTGSHQAYGAVIDSNGILWSSSTTLHHVMRMDPSSSPPTVSFVDLGHFVYGLGLDYSNHLFASSWNNMKLSRVNITTAIKEWTKIGPFQGRGVACTTDNDVWVASTFFDRVYRYANDGTYKNEIYVGNGPTGVAMDSNGKVWACNLYDNTIRRIDPTTNTVDLTKSILGSGGHYSYSDMTGMVARSITTKIGTWTVVFDSEEIDVSWGKVSWTSYEPSGTSVTVKVRSSNGPSSPTSPWPWSSWESASNGVNLSSTPDGRYLQIETTLQITSGDESPILYDLTVEVGNQPPVADFTWTPLEPEPGETVMFDASSSYDPDGNIVLYEWDWDNNGIYDESYTTPTATHTWNQEGSYPVTLRVTDNDGLTGTKTKTVFIYQGNIPPLAAFIWSPLNPHPSQTVTFDASSSYDPDGNIVLYEWDWDNNGIYDESHTSPTATHSWLNVGDYPVTLRVADNDGDTDTETKIVQVFENQPPVADFTWTPLEPEAGETVMFDASSSYDPDGNIVLYEWDWDNNGIYDESYTTPTATYSWPDLGDYPVTLRVADNDGDTDTETKIVQVFENQPPVADFTWTPLEPEAGETVMFDASSSYDPDGNIVLYEWDWDNNGIYDESYTTPTATYSWPDLGDYPVTLRVADNDGDTDTETKIVQVFENQPPVADFTWTPLEPEPGETVMFDASSSYDPDGNIVLYEWDWDNNGIYDESYTTPTATYSWPDLGDYPVTLRVADNDGDTDTETKIVQVFENQPPVADFTWTPLEPEPGETVMFDASSSYDPDGNIVLYEWDWDNNGIYDESYTTPTATYSWPDLGNYPVTLRVADNDGDTDTETKIVQVYDDDLEVFIDIKPGSYPNSINPNSTGNVPVAILTTDDFDASNADPTTIVFLDANPVQWAMEDVDYDGDIDMILHFIIQECDFSLLVDEGGDYPYAYLFGETVDESMFFGKDTVNLVPRSKAIQGSLLQFFQNFLQYHPNLFPILRTIFLFRGR